MKFIKEIKNFLKDTSKKSIAIKVVALTLMMSLALNYFGAFSSSDPDSEGPIEVNYTEFVSKMKQKEIASATIDNETITAEGHDGHTYTLSYDRWLYSSNMPEKLVESGANVTFAPPSKPSFLVTVITVIQAIIPIFLFLLLVLLCVVVVAGMKGSSFSEKWPHVAKDQSVKFDDVAGQEESKFELQEIKEFLQNPKAYEVTGAKPPRGVLMVGPPGTGKTLLARALAGEAGVNFLSVSGSDFSSMFVGAGRMKVAQLFKKARQNAPCIVFIDEIDSVASKRATSATDVGRERDITLNQLLAEMDGFESRDGVVVIGATNHIEALDGAAIRPGRFDRHVHISNADMNGRLAILKVHTKDKPLSDKVDLEVVARGTPGFSGADLENLVNEAAILAARNKLKKIEPSHFEEARDKVIMGLQRKSMVIDDDDRNLIAVHEAGHAVVSCLTEGSDPVHQATIIPRGRALGLVMRLPEKDRISVPKYKLLADLDVAMAGRAAEEIVFGKDYVTTGASSDIEQATIIARKMVSEWGMGTKMGMIRVVDAEGEIRDNVHREAAEIIENSYKRVKTLLEENKPKLHALAQSLLKEKTLDGAEVRKIVAETVSNANAATKPITLNVDTPVKEGVFKKAARKIPLLRPSDLQNP